MANKIYTPILLSLNLYEDDRGSVHCVEDNMDEKEIKRCYIVENFSKGMIRAWHGHRKGWTTMHVISGAAKLAALDLDTDEIKLTAVVSARKPQIFIVPPNYANGALSLEDGTKILVLSTLTFEQVKLDDERKPASHKAEIWEIKPR